MSDNASPKASYAGGNIEQMVATLVAWGEGRDLGRLSALRAWWQPSKYYIAAPVLGSLLGGARMNDKALACVAALFASHRLHLDKKGFNFGASCQLLADKPLEDKDPFASHFRRVLASDEDGIGDLSQVLRRLIQRLDGKTSQLCPVELRSSRLAKIFRGCPAGQISLGPGILSCPHRG